MIDLEKTRCRYMNATLDAPSGWAKRAITYIRELETALREAREEVASCEKVRRIEAQAYARKEDAFRASQRESVRRAAERCANAVSFGATYWAPIFEAAILSELAQGEGERWADNEGRRFGPAMADCVREYAAHDPVLATPDSEEGGEGICDACGHRDCICTYPDTLANRIERLEKWRADIETKERKRIDPDCTQ